MNAKLHDKLLDQGEEFEEMMGHIVSYLNIEWLLVIIVITANITYQISFIRKFFFTKFPFPDVHQSL